ncbi:hypothetical protein QBC38DRAFT_518307 [Podospora fimiseda]|uniref:Uncharacterized protein n=1 Tax=Podospora fimiseda TaxID=252190 RepID=A0AAN6YNZ0_9PEZI|nr:hypothetical protein QBC38DRAFT_518307 [Podospora fimiseda]
MPRRLGNISSQHYARLSLSIHRGAECDRDSVTLWVYPSKWVPSVFDDKEVITHLKRPSFSDFQAYSRTLHGFDLAGYETFQELELAAGFSSLTSFGVGLDQFSIMTEVSKALQSVQLATDLGKAVGVPSQQYQDDITQALEIKHLSWDLNPFLFRKLLFQRINYPNLKELEKSNANTFEDYTCKLLDLAGKGSWEEARATPVPIIHVEFVLEALDDEEMVQRQSFEVGCFTCFARGFTANLVEVSLGSRSDGPTWVPFHKPLPTPENFRLGNFPKFRIVSQTSEGTSWGGTYSSGIPCKVEQVFKVAQKTC